MVMDLHTKRYLDEFSVDPDSFSEVTTMTQLAATHIMELRGFMSIGSDETGSGPDGLITNVVGYADDDGEPITQVQEHPGYNIIERAWKWRAKLLESLGATRREKMKIAGSEDGSLGSFAREAAEMKQMIQNMSIPVEIS